MRVYSGISWAFEHVDRLAIIEDDCVPSLPFFKFCEELLEKYKDDERIDMISGMNNLGIYEETPYDYFFSTAGSIWGWATWKRAWNSIDFNMEYINDKDAERLITNLHGKSLYKRVRTMHKKLKRGERLTSWSLQKGMNMFLNSGLIVVPKKNLITNVGLTENGANSLSSIKFTPRAMCQIYYMKTYDLDFPLKHPKYIINDVEFKKKLDRLMGNGHPCVRFFRTIESITYRIIYGDFKSIFKGLKRRIQQ
ncbi:MAG: hemolysin activation protein [Bacteroidales bacterium]|nr:hemolysin activation protein [Bacteroidales bacterium]